MQAIEVKKDFYWVGAIDWNIRDFHGYSTPKGTTYNSYLVMDEKIALFDTVKKPFFKDLVSTISSVVDPTKIDYLIVNHVEMDHSGSIPEIVELIKPEKIFCSPMGKKALIDHFGHPEWPYEVVETGRTLSLGKRTVSFLETRMLHWPDSMMSYLVEDKLLISSDGFGEHWATSERFNDQVVAAELMRHAAKYYANILLLYSPLVQKLIETVQKMGIEIETICPDHGLIWRDNPLQIVEAYAAWSRQETRNKAVIIYDTMWNATENMAKAVAEGLREQNVDYRLMNLKCCHRSDIMTEVLDARAVLLGSPTLNNGMMPTMADTLCYMKGLKPTGRIGAAFGSFGWSGEAVKQMNAALEEMKFDVIDPGVRVKYTPDEKAFEDCRELGRKIATAIRGA